jgi:hypothetical protein
MNMRKNGKRLASFLLALVMIFSLLPTEVLASGLDEPIEETPAPVSDKEAAIADAVQKARKLKDRPVSELYDAIGEPDSEDAAPSCMGPGEDVNLYYDGFTVYTYREGNKQTVVDAEISK